MKSHVKTWSDSAGKTSMLEKPLHQVEDTEYFPEDGIVEMDGLF